MKKINYETVLPILVFAFLIAYFLIKTVAIPLGMRNERRGYTSDVKAQIKAIYTSAGFYRARTGEYPTTVEEMEESQDLDLEESALLNWDFEIDISDDGESGTIVATSTDEMRGGEGQVVTYTIETDQYTGYGQPNDGSYYEE
jgi:hypothetical protein